VTEPQPSPTWVRSSRCESNACVEVAQIGEDVALRDSKNPDQHLLLSKAAWSAFIGAIKDGSYQS
jgi:hypothetical protein